MRNENSNYESVTRVAERELGAFISAVTDLYGPEHARLSAEDWLEILESSDRVPDLSARDLRLTTITAAARLANRVRATVRAKDLHLIHGCTQTRPLMQD